MNYETYIASEDWAVKRKARLELDGNRCRLCDEDSSRFRLEVHHRPSSYKKIPNESIEDDLITVCARCHELITSSIREDRYGRREIEITTIETSIQIRREIKHGMENSIIQVDFIGSADNAQRADSRPAKQVVESDQTDFIKARKDRCGL
jgi:hypothetical protein